MMPEQAYRAWRKSSRSGTNGGNCVEVGLGDTGRAVRDTKQAADPNRPMLEFSGHTFSAFLDRVKSGELG
ncbi:DUF397 domain-containing protein [Saccharopolyspora phatthalungensis]|uniref:DUF397 domain-containing protein n=1 Tax=Saccharopolyspora phatthalungensis TaxID=664693 RepID=A0A840QKU6_9PSEU|nr:DUF397 domain-containing protein [Saccharopolyspora phatthalungensis]MBB5159473.1 hypothetical protein [Saccharopolyspora phatthalungensis]